MREHEEIQEKLIEVANRRYATKKFNPDRKIDDDDWRTILEVGRLSPSSFGYEPWQFVELDNPQMRQDLKPIAWGAVNSINGADKLLLIFARKDVTYDSDYVKYWSKTSNATSMIQTPNHHKPLSTFKKQIWISMTSVRDLTGPASNATLPWLT